MKQFKHLSNEEIDKADELIRKQEYELRLKDEEKYIESQEQILNIVLDDNELKQAKKEADEITKYYAYDIWKRLFNKISFYNELACQILFHVMLGQLLANKKIKQQGNELCFRIHFFWSQLSRSGKGKAIEEFRKLCRSLRNINSGNIRFYSSGIDTAAAMIDKPAWDERRRDYIRNLTLPYNDRVERQILSTNDFICWTEAESLIRPNSEYGKDTMRLILHSTEPIGSSENMIEKQLSGWPFPTRTTCSASFIATTRPIRNIKSDVLDKGLFQRFLFYPRNLTIKERRLMIEHSASSSIGKGSDEFKQQERDLIKELLDIQKFGIENEIDVINKEKILGLIKDKLMILYDDSLNLRDEENRVILGSFVAGMKDSFVKIVYHSAIMRKSKYIDLCDVEYAFDIIDRLFKNIKSWLEIDSEEIPNFPFKQRIDKIVRILKINKIISRKELIRLMMRDLGIGETSCYLLLNRISEGNNPIVIIKNGVVTLNNG